MANHRNIKIKRCGRDTYALGRNRTGYAQHREQIKDIASHHIANCDIALAPDRCNDQSRSFRQKPWLR